MALFCLFLAFSAISWLCLILSLKYPSIFARPSTRTFTYSILSSSAKKFMGEEKFTKATESMTVFLSFLGGIIFLIMAFIVKDLQI